MFLTPCAAVCIITRFALFASFVPFVLRAIACRAVPAMAVLGIVMLAFAGSRAQAHPHAWIDVHSTVVLDDAGQATAIEQEWVFDELYSAALVEGVSQGRTFKPEMLAEYAGEVIDNLGPYGYFMKLRVDGQLQRFDKPKQYRGALRGERFVLSFTAPLAQAVDPLAHALEFAVYDPTYFIQMMHLEADPPGVRGVGAAACRMAVHAPDPSPAALARAFAMDWQAEPDDSLGELFAQKVSLQCR